MFGTKGRGQELAEQTGAARFAGAIAQYDGHVIGSEFAQFLAAPAAWRYESIAAADDCHFHTSAAASENHRGKGGRFGAHAFGIGGVLDIAAGVNAIVLIAQSGANGKS
jgi:hypothetical protein